MVWRVVAHRLGVHGAVDEVHAKALLVLQGLCAACLVHVVHAIHSARARVGAVVVVVAQRAVTGDACVVSCGVLAAV